jgi:hypothetical protein
MKRFKKEIDGKTIVKTQKEIVIKKDGRVTYNPTEDMVVADGWVEYIAPEPKPIPERVLVERAKIVKLDELHKFDESEEVNDCIIVYQGQELHYWADKHERGSLGSAVRDCMALGRTEYRLDLRELGVSLSIPCEKLLQMLAVLEVYAIDCYNKTTDHEFAIKALSVSDEIEAYDFRVGYPIVPRFEL